MWIVIILLMVVSPCLTTSNSLWRDSVFFQHLDKIHTSQAEWKLTIVQDVRSFPKLIDSAEKQVSGLISEVLQFLPVTSRKRVSFSTSTLRLVPSELNHLLADLKDLKLRTTALYQLGLSPTTQRFRRGLLPFIGQAASYLFGTVSEHDLSLVQSNLHRLQNNQKNIVHVLHQALTLMNVSQVSIQENRHAINSIIDTIADFRNTYLSFQTKTDAEIGQLRNSVNVMFQCLTAVGKASTQVGHLQSHYERLLLQLHIMTTLKLTPHIIAPHLLSSMLIGLKSKLPASLSLPEDPMENIWFYYRKLKVTSAFHDGCLIFVVDLPLIQVDSQFDLFQIHSFPVAAPSNMSEGFRKATVQYAVDHAALAINFGRTRYFLLSSEELRQCTQAEDAYCRVNKPMFLTSAQLHCELSLFLSHRDINCESHLHQDVSLPQVIFLNAGVWMVITRDSFAVTIGCPSGMGQVKYVHRPYTVIQVNQSCYGTSDFFYIPAYFEFTSRQSLAAEVFLLSPNETQFGKLWDELVNISASNPNVSIPSHLTDLKKISLARVMSSLKDDGRLGENTVVVDVWVWLGSIIAGMIFVGLSFMIYHWRNLLMGDKCKTRISSSQSCEVVHLASSKPLEDVQVVSSTSSEDRPVGNDTRPHKILVRV